MRWGLPLALVLGGCLGTNPEYDGPVASGTAGSGSGSATATDSGSATATGSGSATATTTSGASQTGGSGGTGPIGDWWDDAWCKRRKIDFLDVPEALTDVPLLVVLDDTRIDYGTTAPGGADVRFIDHDGMTVLPHEIERWDPNGTSYVWIKVPEVLAAPDTKHIRMYWCNDAAADAQDPAGVWSDGYAGVWHLGEDPSTAPQAVDSTGNGNDGSFIAGFSATDQVAGQIGGAVDFGSDDRNVVVGTAIDPPEDAITVEAWVWWAGSNGESQGIVAKRDIWANDDMRWQLQRADGEGIRFRSEPDPGDFGVDLPTDAWAHVVATQDATDLRLFLDGAEAAAIPAIVFSLDAAASVQIGSGRPDGTSSFNGVIDEVRISNVARSAGWLETQHRAEVDTLITFGPEESI